MMYNLADIKDKNISLLYEQAFIHFLRLADLIYYFPTKAPKINNDNQVPIYRTVIHYTETFPDEYIVDINKISYRPEKDVSSFGRINRPLQAYFYASGEAKTCWDELDKRIISELKKKDEIAITTSKWILKRDINVCVIPDFDNTDELMKMFIQEIESMNIITHNQKLFLKGINELFREEDDNSNIYQVTSAFCNSILRDTLEQKINIDGFLYTSVKNGEGYNLALFPSLIDNLDLIPVNVVRTLLSKTDINKEEFSYKPYTEAKSINLETNEIIWK
jgi:hypothetical protein